MDDIFIPIVMVIGLIGATAFLVGSSVLSDQITDQITTSAAPEAVTTMASWGILIVGMMCGMLFLGYIIKLTNPEEEKEEKTKTKTPRHNVEYY